ncbi:MAG: winged helix-turn-helix transcriptional regulator [Dehalobacter sp. 4CP]|uniref:autorepressor SdpR family transcription factor n=1 Tax=unclassified Dehalobacter TaxID=2635733 RepID=UPI0013CBAB70|nr:winged helix-turn-helix transcriptional regulator [Dehalobacter sp. 4CP]
MSPYNDTFKALADPTRREMIRFLKERNMTAGEIADQFKISKPSISHHLNILKQAGLVTDERKGQTIVYALDTSVFEEVMRMMFDLFSRKEESKDKQTNK